MAITFTPAQCSVVVAVIRNSVPLCRNEKQGNALYIQTIIWKAKERIILQQYLINLYLIYGNNSRN